MDEMNDETMPAVEEAAIRPVWASEPCCEEMPSECCKPRPARFRRGLFSGAVVGGALAWLLTHKGEEEALEEGGVAESRTTLSGRAEAAVGGVVSRLVVFWAAFRERLRDAVEEGKEGMVEGQAEARARYEYMTKRRRPRR